jgi:hypothetical protein
MALYLHFGPFARYVVGRLEEQIAAIDSGAWKEPTPVRTSVAAPALRTSPDDTGREAVAS